MVSHTFLKIALWKRTTETFESNQTKILFSEKLSSSERIILFLAFAIIPVGRKDKLESSFDGIQFVNHRKWYYPLRDFIVTSSIIFS